MSWILRAFLAGVLALLPLALTLAGLFWLVGVVADYVGGESQVGQALIGLGEIVGLNDGYTRQVQWGVGFVIVFLAITLFGFIVQSRIGPWMIGLFERPLYSIPVIGPIFDMIKRMTAIMDSSGGGDLKNMSPVWCFFGGDKSGAAVFALLPTQEKVALGGQEFLGIMIPTAPVPVGGALLYVPASWVEPAEGAVDHFMSVYVSMGVQPPHGVKPSAPEAPSPTTPPPPQTPA